MDVSLYYLTSNRIPLAAKTIVLTSDMLVDVEQPKQRAHFKHEYFIVSERYQAQTWPTSAE